MTKWLPSRRIIKIANELELSEIEALFFYHTKDRIQIATMMYLDELAKRPKPRSRQNDIKGT